MDRLAQRRERFISLYNQLKTPEGQREILAEITRKEAETSVKSATEEAVAPAAPTVGDTLVKDAEGNVLAKNVNILSENEDGTVMVEGVTPEGNRYAETVPREAVSEATQPAPEGEQLGIGNVPLEADPDKEPQKTADRPDTKASKKLIITRSDRQHLS